MKKVLYLIILFLLLCGTFFLCYYQNDIPVKFAFYTLVQALYWCLMYKRHEKAHAKKAASYHELINSKTTDSHFNWDNKTDFSLEEIKQVALAGILFDIKYNAITGIVIFFEPYAIVFTLIMMFGNAIPIKFSDNDATDGYWYLYPEEFLQIN